MFGQLDYNAGTGYDIVALSDHDPDYAVGAAASSVAAYVVPTGFEAACTVTVHGVYCLASGMACVHITYTNALVQQYWQIWPVAKHKAAASTHMFHAQPLPAPAQPAVACVACSWRLNAPYRYLEIFARTCNCRPCISSHLLHARHIPSLAGLLRTLL